ncbi:MAG: transposase [Methylococcales bacterium]
MENALRSGCPDAPDEARPGAITFVHRFGSALNGNIHFHCCIIAMACLAPKVKLCGLTKPH